MLAQPTNHVVVMDAPLLWLYVPMASPQLPASIRDFMFQMQTNTFTFYLVKGTHACILCSQFLSLNLEGENAEGECSPCCHGRTQRPAVLSPVDMHRGLPAKESHDQA